MRRDGPWRINPAIKLDHRADAQACIEAGDDRFSPYKIYINQNMAFPVFPPVSLKLLFLN
jgi:hypothetical protein